MTPRPCLPGGGMHAGAAELGGNSLPENIPLSQRIKVGKYVVTPA